MATPIYQARIEVKDKDGYIRVLFAKPSVELTNALVEYVKKYGFHLYSLDGYTLVTIKVNPVYDINEIASEIVTVLNKHGIEKPSVV